MVWRTLVGTSLLLTIGAGPACAKGRTACEKWAVSSLVQFKTTPNERVGTLDDDDELLHSIVDARPECVDDFKRIALWFYSADEHPTDRPPIAITEPEAKKLGVAYDLATIKNHTFRKYLHDRFSAMMNIREERDLVELLKAFPLFIGVLTLLAAGSAVHERISARRKPAEYPPLRTTEGTDGTDAKQE